ncbi:MAG: acylphosphatase [Candidatus Omnitrophica bacterium]|nr:acylphosphatase [Candidatus Omnitrophota bacterium]
MRKQIHVYYSGKVQGVGFRFTAHAIARKHGVAGWVKNLDDARVEIKAEAEEEILKRFLEDLNQYFFRNITGNEVSWSPATEECKEFNIAF